MGTPTTHYQPYTKQHEEPQGPVDARPTALQVIEDGGLVGKLSDKVMIITGCTSGLVLRQPEPFMLPEPSS
jgi:hypothetical protein